jgi:ATP-binding cassette subfamily B protein
MPTPPPKWPSADRLLVSVALHGGPAAVVMTLTAITIAIAETVFPAVVGRALDAALGHHTSHVWIVWAGLLVALIAAAVALDDVARGTVTARSTAWIRTVLLRHVLSLGTRAVERIEPGDLVGRLVGNAAQAARIGPSAIRALANLIPSIGGPVALGLIDPWLCVTFLAGTPVLLLLLRSLSRQVQDVAADYLTVQGRIAARLLEALGGLRTIAAAGQLRQEAGRILEPLPELHEHGIGLWRSQMRIVAQNGLLVALLEVAVLSVAGVELAAGRITAGQMLAAGQYVLVGATMTFVLSAANSLGQSRAAAARILAVLDQVPPAAGTRPLAEGPGEIAFRRVTVRRDGQPVLDGIDLVIPPRALVAVVGRSGAGKSLLGALAGHLVDPDEGEVLLDGMSLCEIEPRRLREAIGFGFERPVLIGETVEDAIAFGTSRPSPDLIVEAAVAARADGFISRLPCRYETPLSEAPMSGGETQRMGLARTFAHLGRVVILDDVAASLDTVTEHHISRVLLEGGLSKLTRLIVAHRTSTAAAADLVVWIEHGAVRAVARHDQLWREPEYRDLFAAPEQAAEQNGKGVLAWAP